MFRTQEIDVDELFKLRFESTDIEDTLVKRFEVALKTERKVFQVINKQNTDISIIQNKPSKRVVNRDRPDLGWVPANYTKPIKLKKQ